MVLWSHRSLSNTSVVIIIHRDWVWLVIEVSLCRNCFPAKKTSRKWIRSLIVFVVNPEANRKPERGGRQLLTLPSVSSLQKIDGTSVTRCWNKSTPISSKSCPESSNGSFHFKFDVFKISQKVLKHLGHSWLKTFHQKLSKFFQSGHTGWNRWNARRQTARYSFLIHYLVFSNHGLSTFAISQ